MGDELGWSIQKANAKSWYKRVHADITKVLKLGMMSPDGSLGHFGSIEINSATATQVGFSQSTVDCRRASRPCRLQNALSEAARVVYVHGGL